MLQELLAERRDDAVIELVAQLVLRNRDLEMLVAKMRERADNHLPRRVDE